MRWVRIKNNSPTVNLSSKSRQFKSQIKRNIEKPNNNSKNKSSNIHIKTTNMRKNRVNKLRKKKKTPSITTKNSMRWNNQTKIQFKSKNHKCKCPLTDTNRTMSSRKPK